MKKELMVKMLILIFVMLIGATIMVSLWVQSSLEKIRHELMMVKVRGLDIGTDSLNVGTVTVVAPGQVWVGKESRDPFKPITCDTVRVLEIRSGYALVVYNGDTMSFEQDLVRCCDRRLVGPEVSKKSN